MKKKRFQESPILEASVPSRPKCQQCHLKGA